VYLLTLLTHSALSSVIDIDEEPLVVYRVTIFTELEKGAWINDMMMAPSQGAQHWWRALKPSSPARAKIFEKKNYLVHFDS
jgi:hypothetical protein